MKIGLVQDNILWENKRFNLTSSKSIFKTAKASSIDLLLFPEMSFTGFSMNIEKIKDSDSETLNYISSLCITYGINAGIGYVVDSPDGKGATNNYSIIGRDGAVLCTYTKIHPFSYAGEDKLCEKGNDIVFCTIDGITICPFICYDLRFPEIFSAAAKKADLIVVPASWPSKRKEQWITLLKARAIDNQCLVAGINRVGYGGNSIYSGNSLVADPNGKILCYGDDGMEEIVECEIDPSSFKAEIATRGDRREDLYKTFYSK